MFIGGMTDAFIPVKRALVAAAYGSMVSFQVAPYKQAFCQPQTRPSFAEHCENGQNQTRSGAIRCERHTKCVHLTRLHRASVGTQPRPSGGWRRLFFVDGDCA